MTYTDAKSREETIDLAALLAAALRKWRTLLLAMLIGALLLGGYKSYAAFNTKLLDVDTVLNSVAADREDFTAEMIKYRDEIREAENKIRANNEAISANDEKIKANNEYAAEINATITKLEQIREELLLAVEQAQTALDLGVSASGEESLGINIQLLISRNNIIETDRQLANLTGVLSGIKTNNATYRNQNVTRLIENESLQDELDEQRARLEKLLDGDSAVRSAIKYTILGAIMGAFIFAVIILLQYVFYGKIRRGEELGELYNVPVFGEASSEKIRRHGKFDRMLDRLEGVAQTVLDKQQVYELAAAGIHAAGLDKPVKLAVTGTVEAAVLQEVCERIGALLPDGYSVIKAENPVYNAAFLADVKQYTVIWVEAKGVSDKKEVDRLAQLLCRSEVKVVGALVL